MKELLDKIWAGFLFIGWLCIGIPMWILMEIYYLFIPKKDLVVLEVDK